MNTRLAIITLAAATVTALPACKTETIVSRRGLLSSIDGAESSIPVRRSSSQPAVLQTPAAGIRQEAEDGTVTLYAKSAQHLMAHIVRAIQDDEQDIFINQILSEKTRAEFRSKGVDPELGFQEIVRRQRDVFRLFSAMPFGEHTPGVYLRSIGPNEFRVQLPESSFGDLKWTGIDVVFEDANYHLRWFVNRERHR